ncbi:MAG: PH domain-containing protein, partial [Clostridiales bacterium]|nr:PH domain-containing protein [Clostridiales bacterium]
MAGKLDIEKPEIIWSDRRRRMGLPLSFTRYELTSERLTLRTGFFNTTTDDSMVYRIMDLRLNISLWAKMCGVGTITLISTDESHPKLVLKNIKQPEAVHRL